MLHDVVPVILSGGPGRRLRPISRASCPKPFLRLYGRHTMLQHTILRVRDCAPPIVVTALPLADLVARNFDGIGIAPERLILEPAGRNTAAALALAACESKSEKPLLILPSDHRISRDDIFLDAVRRAIDPARDGMIVCLGIRPTRPETGFGYIHRGNLLSRGVYSVDKFVEKPSRARARLFVKSGHHDWNSGIFMMSPSTAIRELSRHAPDILQNVQKSLEGAVRCGNRVVPAESFRSITPRSIDVAIMEQTDCAVVIPVNDMGWDDMGTWPAILRRSPRFPHLRTGRAIV